MFFSNFFKTPEFQQTKNSEYDSFPVNILEREGYIQRTPFVFKSSHFDVYMMGQKQTIYEDNIIVGEPLSTGEMFVNYTFYPFSDRKAHIHYPEVSENKDRILYSKNLLRGGAGVPADIPPYMSLFYKNGKLSRVSFTYKNANPEMIVEYYL